MHSKSLTCVIEKTGTVVRVGWGAALPACRSSRGTDISTRLFPLSPFAYYGLLGTMMEARGSLARGQGTRETVCLVGAGNRAS